jgi:CDP-paratose 2-epimerase
MKIIITGGAGFIGCNAASRYLAKDHQVVVIDNLSRPGGERNLEWLKSQGRLTFLNADIRNADQIKTIFRTHLDADLVLHFAGQVAVTSSVSDPRSDFEANALGTFNVLEASRLADVQVPIIFSSSNKVYGGLTTAGIVERDGRHAYSELPMGVSEQQNLDFHSPYGCSKGAADQYVRDYHRIYGLQTVVFRQSCIYGYRQFGVEDQGWVAWFIIAATLGRPITVYGDGKQVRDVLFIDDLLDAFDAAATNIDKTRGQVYNIGGGPQNLMSLRELIAYLGEKQNRPVAFKEADWRPGDQKVYVSDIRRAKQDFGWSPKICVKQGLDRLYDWVASNQELFQLPSNGRKNE